MKDYEPEGFYDPILHQDDRAREEGNGRMEEIAHRLQSRSESDATYLERWNTDGSKPRLNGIESCIAYDYAVENDIWYQSPFAFGLPGPSGDENDTVIGQDCIYKVNNLMHVGGSLLALIKKVELHNMLFPLTAYSLVGFTNYGFGTTAYPILKQEYIHDAVNATDDEIAAFMRGLGFERYPEHKGGWIRDSFVVWDLLPKNVLRGKTSTLYVIDAEFETTK